MALQFRRGPASDLPSTTLADGEPGWVDDANTEQLYVGSTAGNRQVLLPHNTLVLDGSGNPTATINNPQVAIYYSASVGVVNLNLEAAAAYPPGFLIVIHKTAINGGNVIITPNGLDTLNGAPAPHTVTDTGNVVIFRLVRVGSTGWRTV